MEIHRTINVRADVDAVWAILVDPHQVVECVPGATIVSRRDDGTFDATLAVKFGPARLRFSGRVEVAMNDATRSGQVTGQGRDAVGGTRVRAVADVAVHEADGGCVLTVDSRFEISGRLAPMIEGGANLVARRLSDDFARCLAQRLANLPAD